MNSLLDGLPTHLKPGGRCLLAYGHAPAIKLLRDECARRGYEFKILDKREIDQLDRDFLPGMLMEVRIPLDAVDPSVDAKERKEREEPSFPTDSE